MRRAKPISVVVKAPSRGLVTRLPSISADLLPTQSSEIQGTILSSAAYQRSSAVAQNVRYEDGVVCAAPGHQRIFLSSELLQGIVAYWPLQEPNGTRFDATPNGYNLTDVPGTAPGVPDILTTPGILGLAALFPPMPPISPVVGGGDSATLDSALSSGFINPLIERLPKDLFTLDSSLSSGAMTPTVLISNAPGDSISVDGAFDSGIYTETVIVSDAPGDSISLDSALNSGTYALVVIVSSAPGDSVSLDTALSSGSYTETVIGPISHSDSFALDSAILSGSYG